MIIAMKTLILIFALLSFNFSVFAQKVNTIINGQYGVYYNIDRSICFQTVTSKTICFSSIEIQKLLKIFETADKLADDCSKQSNIHVTIKNIGFIQNYIFTFKYNHINKISFILIEYINNDNVFDTVVLSRESIKGDKQLFEYFISKFRDLYYQKVFKKYERVDDNTFNKDTSNFNLIALQGY